MARRTRTTAWRMSVKTTISPPKRWRQNEEEVRSRANKTWTILVHPAHMRPKGKTRTLPGRPEREARRSGRGEMAHLLDIGGHSRTAPTKRVGGFTLDIGCPISAQGVVEAEPPAG